MMHPEAARHPILIVAGHLPTYMSLKKDKAAPVDPESASNSFMGVLLGLATGILLSRCFELAAHILWPCRA